jgi:hypothetical protein
LLADKEMAYVQQLEWDFDRKVFRKVSDSEVKRLTTVRDIRELYDISLLSRDILGHGAFGVVRKCQKGG